MARQTRTIERMRAEIYRYAEDFHGYNESQLNHWSLSLFHRAVDDLNPGQLRCAHRFAVILNEIRARRGYCKHIEDTYDAYGIPRYFLEKRLWELCRKRRLQELKVKELLQVYESVAMKRAFTAEELSCRNTSSPSISLGDTQRSDKRVYVFSMSLVAAAFALLTILTFFKPEAYFSPLENPLAIVGTIGVALGLSGICHLVLTYFHVTNAHELWQWLETTRAGMFMKWNIAGSMFLIAVALVPVLFPITRSEPISGLILAILSMWCSVMIAAGLGLYVLEGFKTLFKKDHVTV